MTFLKFLCKMPNTVRDDTHMLFPISVLENWSNAGNILNCICIWKYYYDFWVGHRLFIVFGLNSVFYNFINHKLVLCYLSSTCYCILPFGWLNYTSILCWPGSSQRKKNQLGYKIFAHERPFYSFTPWPFLVMVWNYRRAI